MRVSQAALALVVGLWVFAPRAAAADDPPTRTRAPILSASTATTASPSPTRASTTAASRAVLGPAQAARRAAMPADPRGDVVEVELRADAKAKLGVHAARVPDGNDVDGSPLRAVCIAPCTGKFRAGRWALSVSRPGGALSDPAVVNLGPSSGAVDLTLVDRSTVRRTGVGLAVLSGLVGLGLPVALQVSRSADGVELLPIVAGGVVGALAGIWLAGRDDEVEARVRERDLPTE
jgi:hypothetical protein